MVRESNKLVAWLSKLFAESSDQTEMKPRMFVSYRRTDKHAAKLIRDRLTRDFGEENIFFDVHGLKAGDNFPETINRYIEQSQILILILGPRWLELLRENEKSADVDWVRFELESALKRGLKIIPVRVDGAVMPAPSQLPAEIRALAESHAPDVRCDEHFESDMDLIVRGLGKSGSNRGAQPTQLYWDQDLGRQRGIACVIATVGIVLALALWRELWPLRKPNPRELGFLLYNTAWVAYDPSEMELDQLRQPIFPDSQSLAEDLDLIRESGFNGIVTSTSAGTMELVPRLAQERGLRVIMGIWAPDDPWELSRAMRQAAYVDAFCVGHSGLPERYSIQQLERAVSLVQRRTGKPVAVSEWAIHYSSELAQVGDWLYPDAHLTIRDSSQQFQVDVDRDVKAFMTATQSIAGHAQTLGKPLVFANVAYPYAGIPEASRHHQAAFYSSLMDRLNDPQIGHSVKVAIIAQSAFDCPWKTDMPFFPWDKYTGLIDPDHRDSEDSEEWDVALSPAGIAIRKWFPLLNRPQSALNEESLGATSGNHAIEK